MHTGWSIKPPSRVLVTPPLGRSTRPRTVNDNGLRGMGQSSAQFESSAAWYDLLGKFRQAAQQLAAAEDLFRRDAQGSGLDGRELIRLRNELTALQSQFQYWWTLAFGTPASLSGLGALGAIPLAAAVAAAAIAVKLALVAAGIYVLSQIVAAYQTGATTQQVQTQTQAQTVNALLVGAQQQDTLAVQASARGDDAAAQQHAAEANRLRAQAAGLSTPGLGDWLNDNWPWVAGITFAVMLGPELIRKI